MRRRYFAMAVIVIMIIGLFSGCTETAEPSQKEETAKKETVEEKTVEEEEIPAEGVVLTVAGGWTDCRALDAAADAFTDKYPNCTIVYEYLQDYYASLEKRMSGEAPVDMFFTSNIQAGSEVLPYALDVNSCEGLDLSNTFEGLIDNFTFREENAETEKLYAIPLGAELRGMYVNTTLLDSLGLKVPEDRESLLDACKVLKEKGYIPMQGNPGSFAQTLIYPWICNIIANADDPQAAYDKVNAKEPGLGEMFSEPYEFLYSLVENDYYDYKTAQTDYDLFNETTDEDYARYFLNIKMQGDSWEKTDDVGIVAFMPAPMSLQSVIDKTKEDYHSEIEYEFILSPVSDDGGFAYMSPAHGIAANKDSENIEWCIKFLDFLFQPENNEVFAKAFNVIPNTKEAFFYIGTLFDVPDDHISHLGQVTFDYGFYDAIQPSMTDVSKANNPKYMLDDGSGNLSLYPLDYYMDELENNLQES